MQFRLIFDTFTMTNAETMGGVRYKQSLNAEEDFHFGVAAMSEVTFAFRTAAYPDGTIFEGQEFVLQASNDGFGQNAWVVGLYTIDTVKKSGMKTAVTAYDNMKKFEVDVVPFLETIKPQLPMMVGVLFGRLCSYIGVSLYSSGYSWPNENVNIYSLELNGGTCRNLLSYIADALMINVFARPDGGFSAIRYGTTTSNLTNADYVKFIPAEYATDKPGKLRVVQSNAIFDHTADGGDPDNIYVVHDNPVINGMITVQGDDTVTGFDEAGMLDVIKDITYTPAEVRTLRDFGADAGDLITVDGKTVLVMEKTMTPSGVVLRSTGGKRRQIFQTNENLQIQNLSGQITEAGLKLAKLENTTEGFRATIETTNQQVNELSLTVGGFDTRITSAEGKATAASQKVDSIRLSAETPTTESTTGISYSSLGGEEYTFYMDSTTGGYFVSNNFGDEAANSYAIGRIDFNFSKATTVVFRCINYAESSFDYGVIGSLDTSLPRSNNFGSNLLKSFSGLSSPDVQEVEVMVPAGAHFIEVGYRKDGSENRGNDSFKVKAVAVEYGESTVLTLTAGGAELSSAEIKFRGVVTFESLATPGATVIDGGNIKANTLTIETVYFNNGNRDFPILESEGESDSLTVRVGVSETAFYGTSYSAQSLELYGNYITFKYSTGNSEKEVLQLDGLSMRLAPVTSGGVSLGSSSLPFSYLYSENIKVTGNYLYLGGGYFRASSAGSLTWYDSDGNSTRLA